MCMRRELADVFVNMLTLELTQRMKYALAFAVKQVYRDVPELLALPSPGEFIDRFGGESTSPRWSGDL